jgi:rubredoxin
MLLCRSENKMTHSTSVRKFTQQLTTHSVEEFEMDKWECPCGYIYDPEEGDAESNIQIGTAFEDLPEDWVCPKCGAEKEFFEKLD